MPGLKFVKPSGKPLEIADDGQFPVLTLLEVDGPVAAIPQFRQWRVLADGIVPFMRVEQAGQEPRYVQLHPTGDPDMYELPKELGQLRATAGLIRFYTHTGDGYTALDPPLYVEPTSLTDSEYLDLLRRIGELAVAVESAVVVPLETGAQSGNGQARPQAQLRPALVHLSLAQAVISQWPLITERPALGLRHEVQTLRLQRAVRHPRGVRAVAQHPSRGAVAVLMPVASPLTAENGMVAYVLQRILVEQAVPLVRYLVHLANTRKEWDAPPGVLKRGTGRKAASSSASQIRQLIQLVDACRKWAQLRLRESPLASVAPHPPRSLTARMGRSKEYGPVYDALQRYKREQVRSLQPDENELVRAVVERAVWKSSELYERWVLFEIYAQLVAAFGFRPADDSPTPFGLVQVQDGRIVLEEGTRFRLRWTLNEDQAEPLTVEVTLAYEEQRTTDKWPSGWLLPDVWIEVSVNGAAPLTFAIDAKYRRYDQMDASRYVKDGADDYDSDMYFYDLLDTGRKKYLRALDTEAAFIVHSDPRYASYLGEGPVKDLPGGEGQPEADKYVAHKFGSVFATPTTHDGGPDEIERMLRCILVYHARLYNVCWTCRSRVPAERVNNKGEATGKGVGALYRCCDRFWIVTNCTGDPRGATIRKHYLVKFGRNSFHRTKEEDPWSCVCPECGDLFGHLTERGLIPCTKCGGKGYIRMFDHIADGICFKCHGSGTINGYKAVENAVDVEALVAKPVAASNMRR